MLFRSDLNLLKSQFAGQDEKCYVEFIFKIKNKQYRIHREPAWVKTTTKTGNERKIDETVLLEEYINENKTELISTKQNETKEKIQTIIGLSANEFSSIILLPQGQFADFLQKNSKEKQEILEKLFPVNDYKNISEKIAEQSKEKTSNLKTLEEQLKYLQNNFNIDTFIDEKENFEKQIKEENKQIKEFNNRYAEIEKQLHILSNKENLEKKLKDELEKQKILSNQQNEITNLKQTIAYVPLARDIKTKFDNYNTCKEKLNISRTNKENLNKQINELNSRKKEFIEHEKEQKEKIELVSKIENQLPLLKEAAEQENKIKTLTSEIKKLNDKISNNKIILTNEKTFSDHANQEKNDNIKTIDTIPLLTEEKNSLVSDNQKAISINDILLQISENEKEINNLNNSKTQTIEELNKQEISIKVFETKLLEAEEKEKREQNLETAGILSTTLQENKPCPVCGSLLHPLPAKPFHSEFSIQDEIASFKQTIEEQKTQRDKIKQTLTIIETKTNETKNNLEKTKKRLLLPTLIFSENTLKEFSLCSLDSQDYTIEQIETIKEIIENKQKNIVKELEIANQLKQENIQLENFIRVKTDHIKKLETDIFNDTENLTNKKIELAPIEENYKKAIISDEQKEPLEQIKEKEKQKNRLQKEISDFENNKNIINENISKTTGSLITEDEVYKKAEIEFSNSNEVLNISVLEVLNKFNISAEKDFINSKDYFNSISEIIKYAISISEENTIKEKIDNYEKIKSENDTLISNTKKEISEFSITTPRHELEKEKSNLQNEQDFLQDTLINHNTSLSQLIENKKSFDELNKKRQEQSTDLSTLAQLSKDLNGDNIKSKNFTAWILGIYLEEITKYATQRLKKMSNGRYTLLLNSDYKKRNAKTGLDLEVFDSYTGKNRPCNTLSGGETFMTSISLALGLADSIQSNSGGIQLDAIFIDEGFGTLDDETLELSLNILDEIRGQRTVGIISHVTELQNRISSVVHVEKTNTGSHIRID